MRAEFHSRSLHFKWIYSAPKQVEIFKPTAQIDEPQFHRGDNKIYTASKLSRVPPQNFETRLP